MSHYLDVAVEVARQAGKLLLAHFDRGVQASYKGGADLITEADRRSEELIVERLRSYFPKHSVVAEEGGGRPAESPFCWYVDPLDGTTNFVHRYPCFAVSIALMQEKDLLAGVVYDPVREELFRAERGGGAFLNHRPIRVSLTERLAESLLGTGFPTQKRHPNPNIGYYQKFTLCSHGVRRDGSAALDLCYVACGRFDGFWELNLKAWDTAAGTLIVREAGGVVTDFSGRPYQPGDPEIAASNARIHTQFQAVFAEVAALAGSSTGG